MTTHTLDQMNHRQPVNLLSAEFDYEPGGRQVIWIFFGVIAFLMCLGIAVGSYVTSSSNKAAPGERSFSDIIGELAAPPAAIEPGILVLDSDGQPIGPVVNVKTARNVTFIRFRIDPPLPGSAKMQEVQFPYSSFTPLKSREGGLQLRLSKQGTVARASTLK